MVITEPVRDIDGQTIKTQNREGKDMWYVYFADDSWEQGVTVESRQEAEELVADSNGELACRYVA